MKRMLFAAVFAMSANVAFADRSLAASPEFSWTGFYVGVNGGAGAFSASATDYQSYITGSGSGTYNLDSIGAFGGGTIGYNMQYGQLVLGVEADLQWSSFDDNRHWSGGFLVNQASWDWFGTIRGRAGVVFDRALVFATAGAAFVATKHFYGSPTQADIGFTASSDDVKWGLAVGGGVEYAITRNWTAKFEYLYIGLPTTKTVDGTDLPGDIDFNSSAHLGRVGINYKF